MIIKTGFYNWNQFGQKDSFYPEDMPPEWRLAFYANEVECAQLSLSQLNDIEGVNELFDDLPESFDLLIEYNGSEQWPLLKELINNEDINIKAVICDADGYQQSSKDIVASSTPCFRNEDKQSLVLGTGIEVSQIIAGSLNVIFVDEMLDLKQWRALIDEWVAQGKQEHYFLMLKTGVFKSSVVSELRMMIDMLGY